MSSPPSSPIPEDLNYPQELTPRSKIRQLLAPFDDSDDESPPVLKSDVAPTATKNVDAAEVPSGSQSSESDADSEPVSRKPVGRLAAAMKGTWNTSSESRSPTMSSVLSPTSPKQTNKAQSTNSNISRSIFGEQEVDAAPATPATLEPLQAPDPRNQLSSKSDASLPRQTSPGLFVSPGSASLPKSWSSSISVSDSEDNTALHSSNQKLKELLARKKAERRAEKMALRKKEREREARRMEKIASDAADLERIIASESDGEEAVAVRKSLTQQSRPTRKASKKAIEEMNRETQRISREQHLAHQAKVKKTFTTSDFLQRFKSRSAPSELQRPKSSDDEAKMSGALVSSDAEHHGLKDTPPTSPIGGGDGGTFKIPPGFDKQTSTANELDNDGELPTYEELKAQLSQPKEITEQKEEAMNTVADAKKVEARIASKQVSLKPKNVKVILPAPHADDSDDDLEIIDDKLAARAIFQSVPVNKAREVNAHRDLRHLANLTSPSRNKPKARGAMTISELNLKLGQKARQQALHDREERINEARARGIYIPTAEERERDQAEIVSIEKAREEAALLAKEERAKAKKDGTADDFDDSEDEEFEYDADDGASDKSEPEDAEEEIDDELEEEDLFEEENEDAQPNNPFFDNEVEESSDEEASQPQVEEVQVPATLESPNRSSSDSIFLKPAIPRNPKSRKVVSDDEDDEDEQSDQANPLRTTPSKEAFGAFGFDRMEDSGLGLSQAFAGTLNPMDSQDSMMDPEQDSLAHLRKLPPGSIPEFDNALLNQNFVPDSQQAFLETIRATALPTIDLGLSQLPSQIVSESPSKFSEIQVTQDVGFEQPRVPAAVQPIPSTSTIDTLYPPTQDSPLFKRRGKLRRKTSIVAILSESENEGNADEQEEQIADDASDAPRDAFDLIFQNAQKQKKAEEFNKKRSRAKGLVEEHAEESEDEYKGLGGASDDESDGEMDEEDAKMIDEGPVKVDGRMLAAFHADKERKSDEKQLNKLYKDITTGALRKKRGGDFDDLDDSDEELMERRRRKQEEFARMRRALLADERVGKIGKYLFYGNRALC
jgi:mediator of replication checkpoint protein 1